MRRLHGRMRSLLHGCGVLMGAADVLDVHRREGQDTVDDDAVTHLALWARS